MTSGAMWAKLKTVVLQGTASFCSLTATSKSATYRNRHSSQSPCCCWSTASAGFESLYTVGQLLHAEENKPMCCCSVACLNYMSAKQQSCHTNQVCTIDSDQLLHTHATFTGPTATPAVSCASDHKYALLNSLQGQKMISDASCVPAHQASM